MASAVMVPISAATPAHLVMISACSLRVRDLDLELGAAHPPPGPPGAAGGAARREQAPGWALLPGVREPLVVQVVGELDELVHEDHLLSRPWVGLRRALTVATAPGGHHT